MSNSAATPAKGIQWLAEQVNEKLGKSMTPRDLRIIIRKLVRDGTIDRGEGRYEFTGLKDPSVVEIMKAIKGGAADAAKKERLQSLKASKAKDADDEAPARKTRTRKAKVADEDVEDEVPVKKPRARKASAAKDADDAPATKKPAARRRRAKAAPVSDDDDLELDDI